MSTQINSSASSGSGPAPSLESLSAPFRHFGVVVDDTYIISKNLKGLNKERIDSEAWAGWTLVKSGGPECAKHAKERFEKGSIISSTCRKDIAGYNLLTANCQHFADDCFFRKDRYGSSDDIKNVQTVAKTAGAASVGISYGNEIGVAVKYGLAGVATLLGGLAYVYTQGRSETVSPKTNAAISIGQILPTYWFKRKNDDEGGSET